MQPKIFVGYDSRFPLAYAVTVRSLLLNGAKEHQIMPLLLPHLTAAGIYDRPSSFKNGEMFDDISGAPMSTEFAISRFLIPSLCNFRGWAMFCDSDFLFRGDVRELFDLADDNCAVMCVQHDYEPPEGKKMDGQTQTRYARKNWSSMMLINCEHPANKGLKAETVNSLPGRDLHAFRWLDDSLIGALDPEWNWLEGHTPDTVKPKAVHFTRGTPDLPGFAKIPFADEWFKIANLMSLPVKR